MKYSTYLDDIELSDEDVTMADEKLRVLDKHLTNTYVADLRFLNDTHHRKGETVTCSLNVEMEKKLFRAERSGQTAQNALDSVIDAMKRELRKYHDKKKKEYTI